MTAHMAVIFIFAAASDSTSWNRPLCHSLVLKYFMATSL